MDENQHIISSSTPFSSDTSEGYETSDTGSKLKYYGLKKRHFLKTFRKDLIQLSNYTFSVSPPFRNYHKIMSVIRIMQFLLPCLIPAYLNFWEAGTVDQVTMNTIAVIYYIIPPTVFFQSCYILLIIYDIIEFMIILTVTYSTFYYKKYAKLPTFIPAFINLYHSTLGYYFHPIILYIIFQSFSLMISKKELPIPMVNFIFLLLISIICILFNFFFMIIATNQTLLFRPNSLASSISYPRYLIIFATSFINIFFGIAVNLNKVCQIIFFVLIIFLYLVTIFSVFTYGGFIRVASSDIVLSSSITGAAFTVVDLVFIIIDRKGSLAIFFAFVIFFVLMMIINYFILQSITMKDLRLLDSIYEDKDLFSLIKSPNHFLRLTTVGMNYAHPIIIDLNFFMLGLERWKKNQLIYFIYAKFIAIYPEETLTLKYISQSVKMQKLSGSSINCIKKQTKMIMNQRESGLTNELRSKITMIKKQNRSTKHKLGHLWDVVIRGSLSEIEVATKNAIQAMNETNANFKHLLHDFQNNRNVTHFYGVFLKEVMADHLLSDEMHKKTKILLPGTSIVDDQMHEYGIKMFPNLPNFIQQREPIMASVFDTSQHAANDINENKFEKEHEKDLNQIAGLKESIDKLTIPSILGTKIIRFLIFLILFFIPCFVCLIYIDFYIKDLQRPLEFVDYLSKLGAYAFQVIAFSVRYVGESLSIFNNLSNQDKDPPRTFGYSWDTKEQLEHILNVTTYALQNFENFRKFDVDNYYIKQVRSIIFQNTLSYKYYLSPTNIKTTMISIQAAILDFTIQQKAILSGIDLNQSILSSGSILNPINNIKTVAVSIRNAMKLMTDYIKNNNQNVIKNGRIVDIVLSITIALIYIVTLVIEIKWINSNKQETYQCLFSLPKNIVSELAENRFFKNGNKQSEEMNKQDENILKIFHSSGSSDNLLSDTFLLIFGSIIIIILSILCIVLLVYLFKSLNQIVRNSAPHLHYLLASYSMSLSSLNSLNVILFEIGGYPIPTQSFEKSFEEMKSDFELSRDYYHLINAGGSAAEEIPFRGFMNGVRNVSKNCSSRRMQPLVSQLKKMYNDELKETNYQKLMTKSNLNDLPNIFQCSSVDIIYVIIEPILMYSLIPYQQGITKNLDPKALEYELFWLQLISPIYELFIEPLHQNIVPSIVQELKQKKNSVIPIIISFLVIAFIFEVIIYLQIKKIENHIKSVLRLLLHCDLSVIFSSVKITRVLSGDFSVQKSDSLGRSSNFFDTIFKSLPDAIMYANSEMIIQSANQACKSTFGDIELVGKSIKDFFMSTNFNGNIENLFSSVNSNPTEDIAYKLEGSSDLRILKASSMIACGMFVMSCRNVTQSHRYNTLILEEKQNSDKLLSTILPPSLVTRVQEGEKNISFSVQSASILFCDIVSFTPWCGSLPAETVMKTLNILFKRFDSILESKKTMTKIKCIGDCYMAAGGIFAELNQPAVHAKEVVSFGLQCIKELVLINEEINQNLRIRIGINTGGPIVAGVLGIGKPTFEILGPAINRAQLMEQNGMPMMVHISMPVYELICSFNFKFSQQRQIQLKNEVVRTYLVEP